MRRSIGKRWNRREPEGNREREGRERICEEQKEERE
jgi:hypothetical protein